MVGGEQLKVAVESASGQVLRVAGAEGERQLSRARLVVVAGLLVAAVWSYASGHRPPTMPLLAAILALASIAALFVFFWLRRRRYQAWLGLSTSILDAGLAALALGLAGPEGGWLLGLAVLALVAAGLRCEIRFVAAAAITAITALSLAPSLTTDTAPAAMSAQIMLLLAAAGLGAWLTRAADRVLWLASHDPTSGAITRIAFLREAEREYLRAEREQKRLTIVLAEVDEIDRIRAERTQDELDKLFTFIATEMQSGTRRYDLVGRWTDDGFALLFPNASKRIVVMRMETLRDTVLQRSGGSKRDGPGFQVTFSAGVATYPDDGGNFETLLHQANKLLTQARAEEEDTLLYGDLDDTSTQETRPRDA